METKGAMVSVLNGELVTARLPVKSRISASIRCAPSESAARVGSSGVRADGEHPGPIDAVNGHPKGRDVDALIVAVLDGHVGGGGWKEVRGGGLVDD